MAYTVKAGDSWWRLAERMTGSGRNAARVRDFYRRKGIYRLHAGMRIPKVRGIRGVGGGRALAALGSRARANIEQFGTAGSLAGFEGISPTGSPDFFRGQPRVTAGADPTLERAASGVTGGRGGDPTDAILAPRSGSAIRTAGRGGDPTDAILAPRGMGTSPFDPGHLFQTGTGGFQPQQPVTGGRGGDPTAAITGRGGGKSGDTPGFFEIMGMEASLEGTDPLTNSVRISAGLPPNLRASAVAEDKPPTGIQSGTFSPTSILRWQGIINAAQMGNPEELVGYISIRVANKIQAAVRSGNRNHLPETMSSAVALRIADDFGFASIQEFFDKLGYTKISEEIWAKNYETGVVGGSGAYTYTSSYYGSARYSGSRGRRARRTGGGVNYGGNILVNWDIGSG